MNNVAKQHAGAELQADEQSRIGTRNFDWIMTGLSAWLIGGMYLDGWAHLHGRVDESFFTPWHGILYSGLLAVAVFLGIHLYRNHRQHLPWLKALPAGYTLSLTGVVIFALGGGIDLVWHTLFGIEESVDATVSPSHLILALGAILIVTGPLRSTWMRQTEDKPTLGAFLPLLLSLTFAVSVLTFFTMYAHPLVDAWATTATAGEHGLRLSDELDVFVAQAAGVAGVLLQAAILMGMVFIVMRQRELPLGSFTLMFTLNAALMSVLHDRYNAIPAAALAGLAADGLYIWLKPSRAQFAALLIFAFAVPAVYYVLYFLLLVFTEPLWWSIPMVTGTIALAGTAGLLFGCTVFAFSTPVGSRDNQPA